MPAKSRELFITDTVDLIAKVLRSITIYYVLELTYVLIYYGGYVPSRWPLMAFSTLSPRGERLLTGMRYVHMRHEGLTVPRWARTTTKDATGDFRRKGMLQERA